MLPKKSDTLGHILTSNVLPTKTTLKFHKHPGLASKAERHSHSQFLKFRVKLVYGLEVLSTATETYLAIRNGL